MFTSLKKRLAIGVAAAALGAGAALGGYHYWTVDRFLESTNDAYIKADSTIIAPKVSGYISEVLVGDNEPVIAGQVLARIDAADFKAALAQAEADVASSKAAIDSIDAQSRMQLSVIDAAKATSLSAEADLNFARQDAKRYQDLVKTGYGTVQRAQSAEAALRARSADLQHAQASLQSAERQLAVLSAARAEAVTKLAHDEAARRQAELNLSYTTIVSPIDGNVGARSLRSGQYVQAGTQLMAVVPLDAVYVVANFKETQITHMRGGEKAAVAVDSFPGVEIHGRVDSLAPASGLEFALLPPDNATGNFTKIVQRIPVKIRLDRDDRNLGLLRPGMSVESTVDTKATAIADLNSSNPLIASR